MLPDKVPRGPSHVRYGARMKTYPGDPHRVATVLPGRAYTPHMPLLHYTRLVLADYGWTVQEVWWDQVADADNTSVMDVARSAVVAAGEAHHLFVGKSLGSKAMPLAVERNLPGIWLTPLLATPTVAQAASTLNAPSLFIGGTGDSTWAGGPGERDNVRAVEFEGADHCLEIPGDAAESVRILSEVVGNVVGFIGGLQHSY